MKKEGRTRQGTFANANLQLALQALTGPVYATMRDYRSDQQENSLTSWRIHGFSNRLINILRYLSNVSETSFKCFRHLSNLSCSTSLSWFIFCIQTQTKFYKKTGPLSKRTPLWNIGNRSQIRKANRAYYNKIQNFMKMHIPNVNNRDQII